MMGDVSSRRVDLILGSCLAILFYIDSDLRRYLLRRVEYPRAMERIKVSVTFASMFDTHAII